MRDRDEEQTYKHMPCPNLVATGGYRYSACCSCVSKLTYVERPRESGDTVPKFDEFYFSAPSRNHVVTHIPLQIWLI